MKPVDIGQQGRVALALALLLALKLFEPTDWLGNTVVKWHHELVSTMSSRDLNKEAREALTAGYYEGLMNEGARVSAMNHLVTDTRRLGWEQRRSPESRPTGTFLLFEHVPNRDTPDYDDERRKYVLHTNSAGLGDKEYALEKPARTRRIALMGDSISRGLGAPPGGNYESLLEERLNSSHATTDIERFEILNFSVSGYHITQILEAAKLKAAPYRPDVYVVAMSDLSVYRRWHGHIAALVYADIDLKYDYLRKLVQDARLTKDDPIGVFDARLARYRLPTIEWVLSQLDAHATAQGAELMVVLVPTTEDPDVLQEAFLGVREIIDRLGIPVIDLLDTYANVTSLEPYRIAEGDRHPNADGHRLLYSSLYDKLRQDPALFQTLTGVAQ
jgi:lysophospholipase L1-like esterase